MTSDLTVEYLEPGLRSTSVSVVPKSDYFEVDILVASSR